MLQLCIKAVTWLHLTLVFLYWVTRSSPMHDPDVKFIYYYYHDASSYHSKPFGVLCIGNTCSPFSSIPVPSLQSQREWTLLLDASCKAVHQLQLCIYLIWLLYYVIDPVLCVSEESRNTDISATLVRPRISAVLRDFPGLWASYREPK